MAEIPIAEISILIHSKVDPKSTNSASFYKFAPGMWKVTKEFGIHIRNKYDNYHAQWINGKDGKWRLYIVSYEHPHNMTNKKLITTMDNIYDVFQYIFKNKYHVE